MAYTTKRLGYVDAIVTEGRRQGITDRGLIISLSTALVESNITVYANSKVPESLALPHDKVGSDGKSVGIFQQQVVWGNNAWWWGDAATCMDPTSSAHLFFERLKQLDYNNTGRSAGKYAQDVQQSAYPDRYDERMPEAQALFESLGTPTEETAVAWSGDPIWLADVLRADGLECDIYDGAFDRGHGDFGGIWGVIAHHTGSNPPSNNPGYIAKHPTLGLASQLHLSREGKFTLCGVGIAYHAGTGSWAGITANNANAVTIGIEAENNGTEGWSPAQYDAYVRGVAAILWKLGHGSDRVIGHKEWGAIQGKWDPGGIDMNSFRRDVEARLQAKREPLVVVPPVVVNEIDEAAKRAPWVGARVRPEELAVGDDGKGRLGVYENAHIYFYPGIGAFPIPGGGLFEAYASLNYERGILGYPVREFTKLDEGAVQAFQGGVLYRKDNTDNGYVVYGAIGERWAAEGYENGPLGWPVSNEGVDGNDNRYQLFEHGSLYWHSTGVTKLSKVSSA